jgi:hypothetical protein
MVSYLGRGTGVERARRVPCRLSPVQLDRRQVEARPGHWTLARARTVVGRPFHMRNTAEAPRTYRAVSALPR